MYTELVNKSKPDKATIIPEEVVLQKIQSDINIQQQCSKIRGLTSLCQKSNDIQIRDEKEREKVKLPGFIPAGEFSSSRSSSITQYWGRIVLNFNNIDDPEGLRTKIKEENEPSVILAFLSPSGTGLKVIHQLEFPEMDSSDTITDFHKQAFNSLIEYYRRKYSVMEFDESGSDLARLCYYSHDSSVYYNPNATGWKFDYLPRKFVEHAIIKTRIEGFYTRFREDIQRNHLVVLEDVIHWCQRENVALVEHEDDRKKAIIAIKSSFSDLSLGLNLFLQLGTTSRNFDKDVFEKTWHETDVENQNRIFNIGSIIFMAKKMGWRKPRRLFIDNSITLNAYVAALEERDIRIRYNELTHQLHYAESPDIDLWQLGNDFLDGMVHLDILQRELKRDEYDSFIKYIPPRYNPINDFIDSLPQWDGTDRLPSLIATLELQPGIDKKMPTRLLRRWMIGVINGLHNGPALSNDASISPNENLLILIGPQGIGKTRWMRKLMPEGWHQLMAEKLSFNFDDKDDKLLSCEKAIICMDEMAPVLNRKATNEQLKGFLSQRTFNIRVAYGRYNTVFYKIASFIGTSNEHELITDPTGSRRFWPIDILTADYNHSINMGQVWAQCVQLWKEGERHWLSSEEQQELNNYNTDFTKVHPYEEYIARFIEHGKDALTATQICEYINERLNNNNAVNPRQLGIYLKKAGYENETRWVNNKSQRVYDVTLLPESEMGEFRVLDAKNIAKVKRMKKKAESETNDDKDFPTVEIFQ